jgi:hypothetical protein
MRIFGTVSAFAVLTACIAALCYLIYLEPGSSSPQKKPDVATAIEAPPSIPEQYPILEKKSDATAASEHKTLMYAVKTIHEPFNNAH